VPKDVPQVLSLILNPKIVAGSRTVNISSGGLSEAIFSSPRSSRRVLFRNIGAFGCIFRYVWRSTINRVSIC
jgi:hypothetical protein